MSEHHLNAPAEATGSGAAAWRAEAGAATARARTASATSLFMESPSGSRLRAYPPSDDGSQRSLFAAAGGVHLRPERACEDGSRGEGAPQAVDRRVRGQPARAAARGRARDVPRGGRAAPP